MKLQWFILKNEFTTILTATLFGLVSGAANALIMWQINESLSAFEQGQVTPWHLYVLLVATVMVSGILAQLACVFLSVNLTYNLRVNLARQISGLSLRQKEEIGDARLVTVFTEDIPAITTALLQLPTLFINLAVTLGCLMYLGWLSLEVTLFLGLFMVFAIVTYSLPEYYGQRFIRKTREAMDTLLSYFEALNLGFKELKLHARRRHEFLENLFRDAAGQVRGHARKQRIVYTILDQWVQVLYLIFMGALLFLLPTFQSLDYKTITGFAIISLYLRTPVALLVELVPILRRTEVAFAKIRETGLMPGHALPRTIPTTDNAIATRQDQPLQTLILQGVGHTYFREKEDRFFELGPIDLTIQRGELIFLVGGNGSGKTTLAKLIAGLYEAKRGQLLCNGTPIESHNLESFRQNFTAIFSDFFIFEQFLGIPADALDERANEYLRLLQIDHKVSIKDQKLSTTDLSTGQRKRLALLAAFLEDRDFYIFDEWAADQDPEFKDVFYRVLLPEWRARGKTLLVISHDDRYFHLADRIIKMTDGQLESDRTISASTDPKQPTSVPSEYHSHLQAR